MKVSQSVDKWRPSTLPLLDVIRPLFSAELGVTDYRRVKGPSSRGPAEQIGILPLLPGTINNTNTMEGAKPLRPVPQIPDLQQVMGAARVSAGLPAQQTALQNSLASLANLRSAFTPMVPTQAPMYPEIALFSQFNQLLPGMAELAQQQQLLGRNAEPAASRGRTKSNDSKSSSAYASRHQAAEQRRRTRINERWVTLGVPVYSCRFLSFGPLFGGVSWARGPLSLHLACRLDRLRQVVPHAERANTASFLEQVITYIQGLQKRIAELEQAAAGGQPIAQATNVQQPAISAAFMTQAGFSGGPGVGQTPEAAPTASHHSHGAGAQGPCDARDKFSFPCTAAHPAQEVLPSAQPPNTQPGTPPAVSGGHASEAGGASPASSEGCGMPLKKRRVVEGGSG